MVEPEKQSIGHIDDAHGWEHRYEHRSELQSRLILWASKNTIDFPWRKKISQFHALIVEILLQRTRAEQVIPVFNEFRKTFPDARALAKSRITSIRRVIRPLGLIWRAEFIKALGKQIERSAGSIPDNYVTLLTLPGVGPYVASAYLSLHREIRQPIIDSNIVRLYCRLLGYQYDGETRRKKWISEFAEFMTPKESFREFNYSLLDFTRKVCAPKPLCLNCPVLDICEYGKSTS